MPFQRITSIPLYFDCFFFFNEDDLTMTADGVDTYQTVKDAKRYK